MRFLRVTAKNPLVMSDGRARAGRPGVRAARRPAGGRAVAAVLRRGPAGPPRRAARAQPRRGRARAARAPATPRRAEALRRLHGALCESLERHADAQAAVDLALLRGRSVPARPARRGWTGASCSGRVAGGCRRRRSSGRWSRTGGWRASRCTYRRDPRRARGARPVDPHALRRPGRSTCCGGASTRPRPTARPSAARVPAAAPGGRRRARRASATRARPRVPRARCASWSRGRRRLRRPRHLAIDRDLEQASTSPRCPTRPSSAGCSARCWPGSRSRCRVYVHALDRRRERHGSSRATGGCSRQPRRRAARPRPTSTATPRSTSTASCSSELAGHERAEPVRGRDLPVAPRARPRPRPVALAEAVDHCAERSSPPPTARSTAASSASSSCGSPRCRSGATSPRATRKYATRNVGDTVPLVGTGCGSPTGIPFAFADPGRTLELLNPYDPAHANHTLLISGRSGAGKTILANVLHRPLPGARRARVRDRPRRPLRVPHPARRRRPADRASARSRDGTPSTRGTSPTRPSPPPRRSPSWSRCTR